MATTVGLSATPSTLDGGASDNVSVTNTGTVAVTVARGAQTFTLQPTQAIVVYPEGSPVTAATVSGTGSVSYTATSARQTVPSPAGWPTDPNNTYAVKGRRSLSIYDEFSRYANGSISGQAAQIGGSWLISGAQPPTVTSGTLNSTGTGYAGQILASNIVGVACELIWSGSGTGQAMTLITSADAGITVANAVHFNFGPKGFTLTLRKDAGTFDGLLTGSWRQAMKVDGTTRYRVAMSIRGNTVTVFGPNGEVVAATDPRVGLLSGALAIWEPTTSGSTACGLVSAAAVTEASSGLLFPYHLTGDVSAAGFLVGPGGQATGSRNTRAEASVGIDNATGLPALTLGPIERILGILQADVAIGATSISSDVYIPSGSTLQFESGTNSETVTSSTITGTGPYAITVPALAKAHTAGTSLIATGVATAVVTANGATVTMPSSVIFSNVYFTGQTSRIQESSSGVVSVENSLGTGKGCLKTGKSVTGSRPSASAVGQGAQYFDSTLNKPIWSTGSAWVDATGAAV